MPIAKRDKISYLHRKTKLSTKSYECYEKWYVENKKVKWWLLMFISLEIMRHYLSLLTAYNIWTTLSKAFYDGCDKIQVFTLNQKAC